MTTLFDDLVGMREELAEKAQSCFEDWDFRLGGACDLIAEQMGWIIAAAMNVEILEGGQDGDDHAWLLVFDADACELCSVDIPWDVYEVCHGQYRYSRIEDAEITAKDVVIDPLNDKFLIQEVQERVLHEIW